MANTTVQHGTLGLASPWTRALFPGAARAEAEALIPAGFLINVTAVDGKPGPWRVIGYRTASDDRDQPIVKVMELVRRDATAGVRELAAALVGTIP